MVVNQHIKGLLLFLLLIFILLSCRTRDNNVETIPCKTDQVEVEGGCVVKLYQDEQTQNDVNTDTDTQKQANSSAQLPAKEVKLLVRLFPEKDQATGVDGYIAKFKFLDPSKIKEGGFIYAGKAEFKDQVVQKSVLADEIKIPVKISFLLLDGKKCSVSHLVGLTEEQITAKCQ